MELVEVSELFARFKTNKQPFQLFYYVASPFAQALGYPVNNESLVSIGYDSDYAISLIKDNQEIVRFTTEVVTKDLDAILHVHLDVSKGIIKLRARVLGQWETLVTVPVIKSQAGYVLEGKVISDQEVLNLFESLKGYLTFSTVLAHFENKDLVNWLAKGIIENYLKAGFYENRFIRASFRMLLEQPSQAFVDALAEEISNSFLGAAMTEEQKRPLFNLDYVDMLTKEGIAIEDRKVLVDQKVAQKEDNVRTVPEVDLLNVVTSNTKVEKPMYGEEREDNQIKAEEMMGQENQDLAVGGLDSLFNEAEKQTEIDSASETLMDEYGDL